MPPLPPPPRRAARRSQEIDHRAARRRPDRRGPAGLDGLVLEANDTAMQLLGADSIAALQPRRREPRDVAVDARPGTTPAPHRRLSTAPGRATSTTPTHSAMPAVLRALVAARPDDSPRRRRIRRADRPRRHPHARTKPFASATRPTHDPLTGLANRRRIMSILATAVAAQRSRPGHVAAIFVDIDRLKYVNDALGHSVGDRLLLSTAQRLADSVRPDDRVARIGGDEFLVVCSDVPDAAAAVELAERTATSARRAHPDPRTRPALLGEHRRRGQRPRDPGHARRQTLPQP